MQGSEDEGEAEEGSSLSSPFNAIADQGSDGSAADPWDGGWEMPLPLDWRLPPPVAGGWDGAGAEDILCQEAAIKDEEAKKVPRVGDKEPLSALAAEYRSGHPVLLEKIMMLGEHYASIRRTRGDGNCFFRSFMFSYLEHVLETQDRAEVDHIKTNIEECRKTLQGFGYPDSIIEKFFQPFILLLDHVIQGKEMFISAEELLHRSQDQQCSDSVVMFFRFVTSAEIHRRSDFFEPFILGLTNGTGTVDQFCKNSVESMGEESDHIHITALSGALGVPIRVVYLDRSSCNNGIMDANHHDFIPSCISPEGQDHPVKPFVNLLYRPGHYDILYPK